MPTTVIIKKLADLRRKHVSVALTTAIAAAIGMAILILAAEMLVDWWRELPLAVRAVALAINAAVVAFILIRYAAKPIVFGPDDEDLALWVEREEPIFRTRLISTVQFIGPDAIPAGVSVGMVRALVSETETLAQDKDFRRIVKPDAMLRTVALALLVTVLGLAGLALGGSNSIALLKRAFLVPGVEVPRKTRVEVLSGDKVIAKGEAVDLLAVAHGVTPQAGRVEMRFIDGGNRANQGFEMKRDLDARDHYVTRLENVQDSFSYTVWLNDGHSKPFTITAVDRPAVASLDCRQVYPPYTKLESVRRSTGDLSLLAGSRLKVQVTANKKVKATNSVNGPNNHIHLHGSEVDFHLMADIDDAMKLTVRDGKEDSIPLPKGTTGFSVHLVDEYGLTSQNPAVYRIDLVADKTPTLRVTHPDRAENLLTPNATAVIGFDAADDYGLAKLSLKYRVNNAAPDERAPILDLKLDEGGNSAAIKDSSGNGRDGYLEEGAKWTTGKMGGALSLDGKTARAVVPDSPELRFNSGQSFTLTAWVNVKVPPRGQWAAVVAKSRDNGGFYGIWLNGNSEWVAGSRSSLVSPVKSTAGWHLVAMVQDATTGKLRLYVDGQQIAEGPAVDGDGEGDLWIGGAKGTNDYFNGAVDEVRIYNVALSVVELNALANPTTPDANAGIHTIALDLNGQPRSVHGRYDWSIKDLKATPGSVIEWWLEAEDNNNVTGPGIVMSDHFQINVVTAEQKRRELFTRLGSNWEQLHTVSESQEQLNLRLGNALTGHAETK